MEVRRQKQLHGNKTLISLQGAIWKKKEGKTEITVTGSYGGH